MRLLAYISETTVVEKILGHLGLPTSPRPLAPARWPAQLDLFGEDDERPRTPGRSRPSRRQRSQGSRAPPEAEEGGRVVQLDERIDTSDWGA